MKSSLVNVPAGTVWLVEDWWSVLIGLVAVFGAVVAFDRGGSLSWLAVSPETWATTADLLHQLPRDALRYAAMWLVCLLLFATAAKGMGQPVSRFACGFTILYLLSIVILVVSSWESARAITLETPIVALVAGLVIANLVRLPGWLESGFRAEFYIKIGVVLLGATLPAPVIQLAGPVAILQASIVSVVTFAVIYAIARFLDIDRRLAAMLAGGGSVCGVSAVIAIAGAVRARREDVSLATTVVIAWALFMIVLLPLLARAWFLSAGVAGAWIGTSQYADAAGYAAAQTFAAAAPVGSPPGFADQVLWSYTLVKVVGRNMWIGLWAAALSVVSITSWEKSEAQRVDLWQIWTRFPKFILGFIGASLLISLTGHSQSFADFQTVVRPRLIDPIDTMRNWAFTFSFLSIGASMQIRRLAPIGGNAFIAFSAGVVVNLVLGFILATQVFASYWNGIGP